jgi:LysM repeat protein
MTTAPLISLRVLVGIGLLALLAGCSGGKHSSQPSGTSTTAPATTVAPTSTTTPSRSYTVKSGDTLTAIANRYHVSVATIMTRNHLKNADTLAEGQRLSIPPPLPLELTVTPVRARQGSAFHIVLTGARPQESVTFTIHSPKSKYSGSPHTASGDGRVDATYQTAFTDPTGKYTVTASGKQGTTASTSFVVTKNPLAP